MQRRTIIKNGKKFVVNTPGWEDGIGPGAPVGTMWLASSDGNWYSVNVSSSAGVVSTVVNQTTIGYSDNSLGSQIVGADDGNSYLVYLTGVPASVTFTVSQSIYASGSNNAKPYLVFRSTTDNYFYSASLQKILGTVTLVVSQTPVTTGSWSHS